MYKELKNTPDAAQKTLICDYFATKGNKKVQRADKWLRWIIKEGLPFSIVDKENSLRALCCCVWARICGTWN
jgi:hypothetical protein